MLATAEKVRCQRLLPLIVVDGPAVCASLPGSLMLCPVYTGMTPLNASLAAVLDRCGRCDCCPWFRQCTMGQVLAIVFVISALGLGSVWYLLGSQVTRTRWASLLRPCRQRCTATVHLSQVWCLALVISFPHSRRAAFSGYLSRHYGYMVCAGFGTGAGCSRSWCQPSPTNRGVKMEANIDEH